jgi:hypothetical protein
MKLSAIALVLITLLLIGCAPNSNQYYWGNYSKTLYAYKKNPTDKNREEHIKTLNDIIGNTRTSLRKVPPGINAELAMLYKDTDKSGEVNALLAEETRLFPESSTFIGFVNKTLAGGKSDEKK